MSLRLPNNARGVTAVQHPPGASGSGVLQFNSRTGNVTSQPGDYTAAQVTNAADKSSGSQQAFTGEIAAPDVLVSGIGGANIQARLVGATTSGAPTTGTFARGDLVVDLSGQIWICTTAGTPGTWGNAGSSAGVSAFNSRSGAVSPTTGDYTAAQVTNAADRSSGSSQNFSATVQAPDFVVTGLTGATQAARLVGGTTSGHPSTGTFSAGDVVVDRSGELWVCISGGTPGTWTTTATVSASTFFKPLYIEGSGTTSLTPASNSLFAAQIIVPTQVTLTGVEVAGLAGKSVNTVVSLYSAAGTRVAVSNVVSATGAVARVPFTGSYSAAGGVYFVGVQVGAPTTVYGAIVMVPCATLGQGSLAAPASITAPTASTGATQPIVCTY